MKRVQVLLSSFNGSKYIKQQIDSLLQQQEVEVHCLVRDDGSDDDTINILSQYQTQFKNFKYYCGNNVGYRASFMELIRMSGDFEYYAFSDQDDVWEPLKLKIAIDKISSSEENIPSMYFSNCTLVNDNLEKTGMLHSGGKRIIPDKQSAIVQGFAHGCTMVINRLSRDIINDYVPIQNYSHDFWIPLLHIFLGKVIYDEESYILYRQHSNNIFGKNRSFQRILKDKLAFLKSNKNFYSTTAKDLLTGYSRIMTKSDCDLLLEVSDYNNSLANKMKILSNKQVKKNSARGTFILKLLILFSRF